MILHDTASVLIEKNGKFLLVKRSNNPERGYWAVPGGHVDAGETPFQAAARECREEVGEIDIITKKPVFVFVHDIELGHRHKAHVFLGKVAGRLKAGSDAEEIGWYTFSQMKKTDLTHYTKKILNKLYEKQL